MKYNKPILIYILLTLSIISVAQTGADYEISKSSIDAGGGTSNGGAYILNGSIGQADAATEINGGDFALTGGFWTSGAISDDIIFENGFE